MEYAYGVDIGGTSVKIGRFTKDGAQMEMWEIPTRTELEGENILSDIAESVKEHIQMQKITDSQVLGIGVGVPGPVQNQSIVNGCVNLGWGKKDIRKEMEELLGYPVCVENDANVAALGEVWQGGGKGFTNSIMMTLGTGVGGGIIIDGKIYSGHQGASGEIGHIPVRDDEIETCGCGKKGCLEQYVSANGILRMTKKYLEEHEEEITTLREKENLTTKEIFDAAKDGDKVALQQLEDAGRVIGKALATITCVLNPEVAIIGGGVSKAGVILTDMIEAYYKKYAFHASKDMPIQLATLDNQAGVYGAAKMVFQ